MARLVKQTIRQRDFSAGEIDPKALRRDDTKIYKAALRRARNVRPLQTGGVTRRPGRTIRYFDGGKHDIVRPIAEATFDVTFAANRFTVRLLGGAVVAEIAAVWSAAQIEEMSWEVYGRRIFVVHREFRPQVIEYDRDLGTWSIFDYDFRADIGGKLRAPFFRFATYGVTMRPSALTGTITLTASTAVFRAGHVGVLFRYAERQVRILTVAPDGLTATATVIEELPPTYRVTVGSTTGFRVGEIVEGDTSGNRGEVVAIPSGTTIDVTMYKGFAGFTTTEILVGTQGQSEVASQTTSAIPFGAIVLWDEQFMSDERGWPGSVSTDVSRLIFCDFAQLENAIIWSAIAAPDDLEGTGAADGAIFELVPAVTRVFHVAGGADEFVLTDQAIYWIPISADTPLAPGSIEFRRIGTSGAANVRPIAVADGLVFVGQARKRLYAILATGQVSRPYEVQQINPFHEHLFSHPLSLAASDGDQIKNPGSALYVVNEDGTVVVGHGGPRDEFVGWFPWESQGSVTAVAARYGDVIFTVRYTLDSGAVDTVEAIDDDSFFDGSIPLFDLVGTDPWRWADGSTIDDSTNEPFLTVGGAALPFANETLQGWAGGFFLGDVTVNGDGQVGLTGDLTDVVLGWNFTPEAEPFIEDFEGGDDMQQRLRRRKVSEVALTVLDTQTFTADGRVFGSYVVGEDWGQAPPRRSATYKYRQLGRSHDPRVAISQPIPGAFTLVEFTAQVTV